MSLNYSRNDKLGVFLSQCSLIDQWYQDVLVSCISSEGVGSFPNQVLGWFKAESKVHHDVYAPLFTRFIDAVSVLSKSSIPQNLIDSREEWLNQFNQNYSSYKAALSELLPVFLSQNACVDLMTGLRSENELINDIVKELHRIERHNHHYILAMVHISRFSEISARCSAEQVVHCIREVARLIKVSLRAFDDAYYLGAGEFVLSLKDSDTSGGIAALDRLRHELLTEKIKYSFRDDNAVQRSLSVVCCVNEPTPGDSIEQLLIDLREDLNDNDRDSDGSVLEYRELSPLQRLVQKKDKL